MNLCQYVSSKFSQAYVVIKRESLTTVKIRNQYSIFRLCRPVLLTNQCPTSLHHQGSTRKISNMAANGIKLSWNVKKEQIEKDTDVLMERVKTVYDSVGALKDDQVTFDNVVKVSEEDRANEYLDLLYSIALLLNAYNKIVTLLSLLSVCMFE